MELCPALDAPLWTWQKSRFNRSLHLVVLSNASSRRERGLTMSWQPQRWTAPHHGDCSKPSGTGMSGNRLEQEWQSLVLFLVEHLTMPGRITNPIGAGLTPMSDWGPATTAWERQVMHARYLACPLQSIINAVPPPELFE